LIDLILKTGLTVMAVGWFVIAMAALMGGLPTVGLGIFVGGGTMAGIGLLLDMWTRK
jgi:hypothetical protein